MMRAGLWAILSHWRRSPWQLLTLIAGLAVATALWSGVQAINAEARASYADAARTLEQGALDRFVAKGGESISELDHVTLRRAGWLVSPVLEGRLPIGQNGIGVLGIEPLTLPRVARPGGVSVPSDITLFVGSRPAVIAHPKDTAGLAALGVRVIEDRTREPGLVVTDIGVAQTLLQRPGLISYLLIDPDQPKGQKALEDLQTRLVREQPNAGQADVARLTDSFHMNLTAFGLLAFAVGIFIVYGAIGLAFEQRRPVFRTLRALGFPLRSLMLLLGSELALLAFLAGLAGVALGYAVAGALLPDVAATLRGLYGAEVPGTLSLRFGWWMSGLSMAFLGTGVAAIGAFVRLSRLPILAANQPRAWTGEAARMGRWLAIAAAALALTGLLIAFFGEGLVAGFALLACLLLAVALALPVLLDLMLRGMTAVSQAAILHWFWADTRQQLPGLSMALMALLLAMSANIGVSTMVSSFRLTFVGYLDQRLASDVYLSARTPAQAAEIADFLRPRVSALLPLVSVEEPVAGQQVQVFGVIDHSTYRDNWPLLMALPNVWERLAAGDGALINEQLFRGEGLALGDPVPGRWADRVIGVYSDYGNPEGQVILGSGVFAERYPEILPQRYGVNTSEPEAIIAEVRSRFDLPADAVLDQVQLKAFSMGIFEQTFAVTRVLNVLTLGVAGLAMLISLLTLATMRLPQLAPVWALGLTRGKLAGLELLRALVLAALTGALALPLGLLLAWVLLAVVNVEAFGWRLPMHIFPLDYVRLGIFTMLAATVAAFWPALRLARTPPSDLLKVFTHER